MTPQTDRLVSQWGREARKCEHDAEAHRVMAQVDREGGRHAMAARNDNMARTLTVEATVLRRCARQLNTAPVR